MQVSDSEVVARAQAGDQEAFRMLIERHGRSVYRLAYRLTGRADDAEDVVQETFLKVFRNLDSFQERARFDTWLYRVASNAATDLIRKRQRHDGRNEPLPAADHGLALAARNPGPERLADSGELGDRIAGALQRLTVAERTAFCLRHVQGMSIDEIGTALQLGSGAVKNTIFRAVQKLRQDLAPLSETS